ncbi:MAG TPA: hypothetical protein VGM14_12490 [Streptosporangiaceae bacterium]|jgi:hypothetical protein
MVSSLSAFLTGLGAAAVTTGILLGSIVFYSLDEPRWKRKFARSFREHKIRSDLIERYYEHRPTKELYALVPHLALRAPIKRRNDRFRLRAQRATELRQPLRGKAENAAMRWIDTVGALAEEAARSRVDLRPFLGTYHLGVIREGVIAVPVALSIMTQRRIAAKELDRLAWGLALVELAVAYNSHARQQRDTIFFLATGHEPPIGPVLRAPVGWRPKFYDLIEFFAPPLRLPRWGRWRWEKWLRGIDRQASEI